MITQDMVREFLQKASALLPDFNRGEDLGFENDTKALTGRSGMGGGIWKAPEAPKPKVPKSVNFEKPKAPVKPQEAPENNVVTNALGAAGRWAGKNLQTPTTKHSIGNTQMALEDGKGEFVSPSGKVVNMGNLRPASPVKHQVNSPEGRGVFQNGRGAIIADPGARKIPPAVANKEVAAPPSGGILNRGVGAIKNIGTNFSQMTANPDQYAKGFAERYDAAKKKELPYWGTNTGEAYGMSNLTGLAPGSAVDSNTVDTKTAIKLSRLGARNPVQEGAGLVDDNITMKDQIAQRMRLRREGFNLSDSRSVQNEDKKRTGTAYGINSQDALPGRQELAKYMEYVDSPDGKSYYQVNPSRYNDLSKMQKLEGWHAPGRKYSPSEFSDLEKTITNRPKLNPGILGRVGETIGDFASGAGDVIEKGINMIGANNIRVPQGVKKFAYGTPVENRRLAGKKDSNIFDSSYWTGE